MASPPRIGLKVPPHMKLWLVLIFSMVFFSFAVRAEQVTQLSQPDLAAALKFKAISEAKREIYFSTYVIKNDHTSYMLLAALKDAANRGVKVYVVLDHFMNKADRRVLAALADAGAHVEIYRPPTWRNILSGAYLKRMHDKLLLIDRKILFMGDRNSGADYYNYLQDIKAILKRAFISREVMVVGGIGQKVHAYIRRFLDHGLTVAQKFEDVTELEKNQGLQILNKAAAKIPKRLFESIARDKLPDIEAEVDFFHDEPGQKGVVPGTHEQLLELMRTAQKSLLIENPYPLFTNEMMELVAELRARGVRVVLYTNSTDSNNQPLVAGAWPATRKRLVKLGVEIHELRGEHIPHNQRFRLSQTGDSSAAGLHSKVMIVDDLVSVVTSYNMDPRSAYLNTEVALPVRSAEYAKVLRQDVEQTFEQLGHLVAKNGSLHANASTCRLYLRFLGAVLRPQL